MYSFHHPGSNYWCPPDRAAVSTTFLLLCALKLLKVQGRHGALCTSPDVPRPSEYLVPSLPFPAWNFSPITLGLALAWSLPHLQFPFGIPQSSIFSLFISPHILSPSLSRPPFAFSGSRVDVIFLGRWIFLPPPRSAFAPSALPNPHLFTSPTRAARGVSPCRHFCASFRETLSTVDDDITLFETSCLFRFQSHFW